MFASRNENSVALMPTRFVWPYGGRNVLLSGSFTRWSDLIPLSPVEGSPTVFQVIYNLTPGYHQYKFFVDGEWRHDEHQPFVSGNYGVVNTIFLAREPDSIPSIFTPESAIRSHMDVDTDLSLRLFEKLMDKLRLYNSFEERRQMLAWGMSISLRVLPETAPGVSENDIELSRHRISAFLSTHTAYELLPESGKVITLDVNLPVKQAFHILYEQGIPVAPLWDFSKSQFVGILSALDFILIFRELGKHGSSLTEEQLETHSISAWKEGKLRLNGQINGTGSLYPKRLIHVDPYEPLKEVALKILQNKVSTVPVIHSTSQDGSCHQLLHMASLSAILKCICRHFRHSSSSLPVLQQPIYAIPLGTWVPKIGESASHQFAMLRPNSSLSSALSLLVEAGVSSIPVVDNNDSLLDVYCRSDITALAKDRAYAQIHLDEISIQQALQLGQDASLSYGFYNGQRCQMCLRSDPLHKVMERLSIPGARRVVIVEAGSKRVEGVISVSDVLNFFIG